MRQWENRLESAASHERKHNRTDGAFPNGKDSGKLISRAVYTTLNGADCDKLGLKRVHCTGRDVPAQPLNGPQQ